jgi:hypothetical protein
MKNLSSFALFFVSRSEGFYASEIEASPSVKSKKVSIREAPPIVDGGANFKVVIRTRPPIARELEGDVPFRNVVHVRVYVTFVFYFYSFLFFFFFSVY